VKPIISTPVDDEEDTVTVNQTITEPRISEKQEVHEEEKIPITERIKIILSKMFEVEDQPIK